MSAKAINIKLNESQIFDVKKVASVFHLSITEVIREALDEYLKKIKDDPFYKLTVNVEDASVGETNEILGELERLSDDDLAIASVRHFSA